MTRHRSPAPALLFQPTRQRRRRTQCVVSLLALLGSASVIAARDGAGVTTQQKPDAAVLSDTMPVPPHLQVPVILRILTYDRKFVARSVTSGLRIGIVFSARNADSVRARDEVSRLLEGKSHRNKPIHRSAVEYTTDAQVEALARAEQINVFYVAPGAGPYLDGLLRISQSQQIITTTGVPAYVEKGVAVGVEVNFQDKPHVLINLQASKAVGSEFDAGLLRIARVVR